MRASYVYVYIDISGSTWKALAPTHIHTCARISHTFTIHALYVRDRTRDCANGEHSYKSFHAAHTMHRPARGDDTYIRRVRPSVNCTLHACARALVHRERLSASVSCVRVRCTEDIVDGYRADPHDNRVPPGSSFLQFYPTERFSLDVSSNHFRIVRPLSRSSYVARNAKIFTGARKRCAGTLKSYFDSLFFSFPCFFSIFH